jgi:hypothetical protein
MALQAKQIYDQEIKWSELDYNQNSDNSYVNIVREIAAILIGTSFVMAFMYNFFSKHTITKGVIEQRIVPSPFQTVLVFAGLLPELNLQEQSYEQRPWFE